MSSFALKIIALISMTIDHAESVLNISSRLSACYGIDIPIFMTWIGRMALPIYAFLVAEGCRRTRSIPRYMKNLVVFFFISEVVFKMAIIENVAHLQGIEMIKAALVACLNNTHRNIFFTLALGAACIYGYERLKDIKPRFLCYLPVFVVAISCDSIFVMDYGMVAIVLIFALYIMPKKFAPYAVVLWGAIYLAGFTMPPSTLDRVMCFVFAASAAIPIALYNGERGRQLKWTFYAYYPFHLLILVIIRSLYLN